MDKPLLYILIALAGTLLLFAMDVFPYPFGLIVLTLLALGRLLQIKGPASLFTASMRAQASRPPLGA